MLLALGSLLLASGSPAAEPTDLSPDLAYLRVHSLAESAATLKVALEARHALVLDLRYATADEESMGALRIALALHPSGVPLFVLVSPSTPAAAVDAVNGAPGTCLSLGIAATRSVRVAIKAEAAADRRAYDALDAGTPVATLISGKIEKERFDEATLVQEFKNGNADAAPPTPPDPADDKPEAGDEKPAPLVDRVLQRAVQLHQALLALRR